jgi:predicted nucleotidyltransferase
MPIDNNIVSLFKSNLEQLYGTRLSRLVLFGSYARGEETEESDIDFLVVLKDKNISVFSEIEKINNKIYNIVLESGKIISFVPTTEDKFEKSSNYFYGRIKQEGITL